MRTQVRGLVLALLASRAAPQTLTATPSATPTWSSSLTWMGNHFSSCTVSTLAGSGAAGGVDGTGTVATFNFSLAGAAGIVAGVAAGIDETVYVSDSGSHVIRTVSATGATASPWGLRGVGMLASGVGSSARFFGPTGIAVDTTGRLLAVGDTLNLRLRRLNLTAGSTVSTLSGTGSAGGLLDGRFSNALWRAPAGVAFGASGTVWAADSLNHAVRMVSWVSGTTTTIAGGNGAGFADGAALGSRFSLPTAVAVDVGRVFVADTGNHAIRIIAPIMLGGAVATVAGRGSCGFADGAAAAAAFCAPVGLTIDAGGRLWIVDRDNSRVRTIDSALAFVSTVCGSGVRAVADGACPTASFAAPAGITLSGSSLVITDANRVRVVVCALAASPTASPTPSPSPSPSAPPLPCTVSFTAVTTRLAGSVVGFADGAALGTARLEKPWGVTSVGGLNGTVFFVDQGSVRLRMLNMTSGIVATVAGNGLQSPPTIDGPALATTLNNPTGTVADPFRSDIVYITQFGANRLFLVNVTARTIAFFAGSGAISESNGNVTVGSFNGPIALAVGNDGTVMSSNRAGHRVRGVKNNLIFNVAGAGPGSTDGVGGLFNGPSGVACCDAAGAARVADTMNHRIRGVSLSGTVWTIAGWSVGFADGSPGAFNQPVGVAIDINGHTYVADLGNFAVRVVGVSGFVSTLSGSTAGSADGAGVAALFNAPRALTVIASNSTAATLVVSDYFNGLLRRVDVSISGAAACTRPPPPACTYATTTLAVSPALVNPYGIDIAEDGSLIVADQGSSKILNVSTVTGGATLVAGSVTGTSGDGVRTGAIFDNPVAVTALPGGYVLAVDYDAEIVRLVSPGGVVSLAAGGLYSAGSIDGSADSARFSGPIAASLRPAGSVYILERSGARLRMLSTGGVVTTIATAGVVFNQPSSISVDAAGVAYIADRNSHSIVRVESSGAAGTVAGGPRAGFADGVALGVARFNVPHGVTCDASTGNVFIADTFNNAVRMFSPLAGVVITVAGSPSGARGFVDGVGGVAHFANPRGLVADRTGIIYVSDSNNNAIRRVMCVLSATPTPSTSATCTPTQSQTSSGTRTGSSSSTGSGTDTTSGSLTAAATLLSSRTPSAAATPASTLSMGAAASATSSATLTETTTPSATASASSSASPSGAQASTVATPSPTATLSPSTTPSATAGSSPSSTASSSITAVAAVGTPPSGTGSASATDTAASGSSTPTSSATPTTSSISTASLSVSPTPTPTPSVSLTMTSSKSSRATPSPTPSQTAPQTALFSPRASASNSPSAEMTSSQTRSVSGTTSTTQTVTGSSTPSSSAAPPGSSSGAPSPTATASSTASPSSTLSLVASPSATPSTQPATTRSSATPSPTLTTSPMPPTPTVSLAISTSIPSDPRSSGATLLLTPSASALVGSAGGVEVTASAAAGVFVGNSFFLAAAGVGAAFTLALVAARVRATAAVARAAAAEALAQRLKKKATTRLNPMRAAARPSVAPPAGPPATASAFRSYADEAARRAVKKKARAASAREQ